MTPELTKLVWVLALNALIWIPYIINGIMVRGLIDVVGYPADPKPLSPWAERAKKAHYNAVENLVVFAAAVLVLNAVGISNDATILACTVYFWPVRLFCSQRIAKLFQNRSVSMLHLYYHGRIGRLFW